MPIKSALECAKANENPAIDTRSPLRAALDDLAQALVEADLAVGGLGMRLEPALEQTLGGEKGCDRPAYSAPLLEEVHQLTDRVCNLTDRVRSFGSRLVL